MLKKNIINELILKTSKYNYLDNNTEKIEKYHLLILD